MIAGHQGTAQPPATNRTRPLQANDHQARWCRLLDGFENEQDSAAEDAKRWEAAWVVGVSMFYCDDPACAIPVIAGLDEAGLVGLFDSLESPALNWRMSSLASSVNMRRVRQHVVQAVLDAFEAYPDEELAVATVIKRTLHLTPEQLMKTSASALKNQFLTDLKRTGIAAMSGPLVAFLHGEFESTSGLFVLHWHVLTILEKGKALHRLDKLEGYVRTHTGAAPIRVQGVKDRVRQVSYLLKSFWGQHPIRDGVRQRRDERIDEPFHTLSLVWLDRQRLRDITIMNDVWSSRKGGTEVMKALYFQVMR